MRWRSHAQAETDDGRNGVFATFVLFMLFANGSPTRPEYVVKFVPYGNITRTLYVYLCVCVYTPVYVCTLCVYVYVDGYEQSNRLSFYFSLKTRSFIALITAKTSNFLLFCLHHRQAPALLTLFSPAPARVSSSPSSPFQHLDLGSRSKAPQ